MNIDTYQDRWLHPNYHLITLSRMLKSMCDLNNFHQLVKSITRLQFNSVTNTTSMSIIDYVYTNARFRCSDVEVSSLEIQIMILSAILDTPRDLQSLLA